MWCLALLLLAALARFSWIGSFGLMGDEAYYWDWGRRLAAGYYDHPPAVALLARLGTSLCGATAFGVRSCWALLGTLLVGLCFAIGRQYGSPWGGVLAASLVLVGGVFVATSGLATPDGPELFWWAAVLLALQSALRSERLVAWAACGAAFGCGLETKYPVVLLLPAIFTAMLATRQGRRALRRRGPYLAVAIAAVVFAPNLIWNALHGWTTIAYQLGHGQAQAISGLDFGDQSLAYLTVEAGIATPPGLLLYAVASLAALVLGVRRGDTFLLTLGVSALGTFAFFLLVNGMWHWTFPAYLSAALAAGILGGEVLDRLAVHRLWSVAVWSVFALVLASTAAPTVLLIGALRADRPIIAFDSDLVQQLLDMTARGPALGQGVGALLRTRPLSASPVTLVASSYEIAALAAFYTPGHPRVYGPDNQYGLWGNPPPCPGCRVLALGDSGYLMQLSVQFAHEDWPVPLLDGDVTVLDAWGHSGAVDVSNSSP